MSNSGVAAISTPKNPDMLEAEADWGKIVHSSTHGNHVVTCRRILAGELVWEESPKLQFPNIGGCNEDGEWRRQNFFSQDGKE